SQIDANVPATGPPEPAPATAVTNPSLLAALDDERSDTSTRVTVKPVPLDPKTAPQPEPSHAEDLAEYSADVASIYEGTSDEDEKRVVTKLSKADPGRPLVPEYSKTTDYPAGLDQSHLS